MRIVLVGSPSERDRLRASLDLSMEIVAEFDTLAAARAADVSSDALLVASADRRTSSSDGRDPDGDGGQPLLSEHLTSREVQVLELLAEGLSNKAIATRLGISDQTVKFHVASLSSKLGAVNRTDAVRRAVRRGLIAL